MLLCSYRQPYPLLKQSYFKCYAGKANPYGPNASSCMLLESFKNISLAKVTLSATKTGRWSSVVWFEVIGSLSQCYAQTELCFLFVEKVFSTKMDLRSTLYPKSYYTYQWFGQKIMPFVLVFFCFWVQVIGLKHGRL